MSEAKRAVRAQVRRRAAALGPAERAARTRALCDHLLRASAFRDAVGLVGFVGRGHEPDTRPLLAAALEAGKRVFLPRVASKDPPALVFVEVETLAGLAPGAFGIDEPVGPPAAAIPAASLVLVPGLAFDRRGHRVGHGAGFYDRALAGPLAGCPRAGVCLAPFLFDEVPQGAHDVPVQAIVTDEGWLPVPPAG